jgi:hypothetical protein
VLIIVSTHAPPHSVRLPAHDDEHVPCEQSGVGAEHTVPHTPQLLGSDLTSTQAPLQSVHPGWQLHAPFWQVWPTGHTVPQVPQFCSLIGSQTPLQRIVPAVHVGGVTVPPAPTAPVAPAPVPPEIVPPWAVTPPELYAPPESQVELEESSPPHPPTPTKAIAPKIPFFANRAISVSCPCGAPAPHFSWIEPVCWAPLGARGWEAGICRGRLLSTPFPTTYVGQYLTW